VDSPDDTLAGMAAGIRTGALTPAQIVEASLARIAAFDPALHAFIHVMADRAFAQAHAAQEQRRGGLDLGPLHGIPYAAKDLFDVRGVATGAGCRLLAGNIARTDAAVVGNLARAGSVLLGKTHTVQFAYGAAGVNHDLGTPHNPWHREPHAPGGSSSGSAVAVAAGLAPLALGTDTGGSVRVPAALCGIVGLKTTIGRISRAGVYPLSLTLDSVGPITRTVEDAALAFQAMQGQDDRDSSTRGVAPLDVLRGLKDGVHGLRIAFCETTFFDDVDADIERGVRDAAHVFRALGVPVGALAVPEVAAAWAEPKRPLLIPAEACAVNATLLDHHLAELDPVIGPRMLMGRSLTAPDYFALLARLKDLQRDVCWTLRDVDAVIVPTTMSPARPVVDFDGDLERYLAYNWRVHRNTGLGNLLNLCAVSVPCGFTANGLPIGMQIYAKPFQEDVALRVAYAYEQATKWHLSRPDLSWVEGQN
jgi:aspartyl-tRNA(Asn)/glutamyl-tRNA(Gln) amidotransferase subunit A